MNIDADVRVFKPEVHEDNRGFFYESYNEGRFNEWLGHPVRFVQDNHSMSAGGVIRGLHYQIPPFAQAKLVTAVRGAVFDVVVDLRRRSPTSGQWRSFELNEDNRWQIWIPEGFAHGFLALSDRADVLYKTTAPYSPGHAHAIRYDDPDIGISWPLDGRAPRLSPTDADALPMADAPVFD